MSQNAGGNHHFTIVQTKEAGRMVLSIVPHQWVNGKYLSWPDKKANKLIKDPSSKPGKTWNKMLCTVKRRWIPSYLDAEKETAEMSGHTTDASDTPLIVPSKKARTKGLVPNGVRQKNGSSRDFNNEFFEKDPLVFPSNSLRPIASDPTSTTATPVQTLSTQPLSHIAELASDQELSSEPEQPLITQVFTLAPADILDETEHIGEHSPIDMCTPTVYKTSANQPPKHDVIDVFSESSGGFACNTEQQTNQRDETTKEILAKIDSVKTEITDTVLNAIQTLMTKTIAAVKCDFDAKFALIQQLKNTPHDNTTDFKFTPVSSVNDLEELEDNLNDNEYSRKMTMFMKNIVGVTGDDCNGQNTCYQLVDYFFNRTFMVECSWNGGSRDGTPKCAIKRYTNILNLFFAIVRNANQGFSQTLLEKFFKSILKNSKKRSQSKGLRQSSIHKRSKKSVVNALRMEEQLNDYEQDHHDSDADTAESNSFDSNSEADKRDERLICESRSRS
ncbi:uncharacterized protein LOC131684165 isoform X2 [Topomyia yanbarensis]|uniref:uncharacterized protein LOC131684165 isoform X2 n=1 Tax=Topomyia yanbarensis TaxID=2498891 RepID=UPI00273AE93B|nr:uncharacterized protein LOC131684165 isoform X2 [Topomyia yanbarensis]